MTFNDTIDELLKVTNSELGYPVPIVMGLRNSQYIDLKLFDADDNLDAILSNQIPDNNDLSVVWLDNKNNMNIQSFNSLHKFTSSDRSYLIRDFLNPYKYVGKTTNNKYDIYLHLLSDETEVTIDGVAYENDEIQLPSFKHFKYQNLYVYKSPEKFINAVLIEFIVRNARYNDLLSDISIIEESHLDGETDEEYEFRTMMLLREKESEIDDILLHNYGLNTDEILQLDLTIYKNAGVEDEKNIAIELSTIEPPHRDIILDSRLPEEEFLKKAKYLKNKYEEEKNNYFPLEERLNEEYLKEATVIINKFPKSFQKKQDDLIKALFIFDYIEARKKIIDQLNMTTYKEHKDMEKELYKYDIPASEKKIELKIINEKLEETLLDYPKMNTEDDDSVYHELYSLLGEQAGQCKKLYSHVQKFIKNKLSISNLH